MGDLGTQKRGSGRDSPRREHKEHLTPVKPRKNPQDTLHAGLSASAARSVPILSSPASHALCSVHPPILQFFRFDGGLPVPLFHSSWAQTGLTTASRGVKGGVCVYIKALGWPWCYLNWISWTLCCPYLHVNCACALGEATWPLPC